MSSFERGVGIRFFATGAAQVLATISELRGGLLSWGSAQKEAGQQTGIFNDQMRAFGTTLRYAVAGTAIYALPNLVRNLSQFNVQLGQIQAIGSSQGGLPLVGKRFQGMTSDILKGSSDSITPVSDFNDALVNLYSTVSNVPRNDAIEMVTRTAQAAQLLQTNVTDAQQAFLQMNFAFGKTQNLKNLNTQIREFFSFIQKAPGGVAATPQIIQQLGPLASIFALGHGTQEQMFALVGAALRGGGTPATNIRGLNFAAQSLIHPQTKQSAAALSSIGITPEYFQQPGNNILTAFLAVLQHAKGLGGTKSAAKTLSRLPEDILDTDLTGAAQAKTELGISGGGPEFLAKVFHRVHALRVAARLATTEGVSSINEFLGIVTDAQKGHVDAVADEARAWKDFEKQAQLKKAAIAIHNMGIQVAKIFEPVLGFGAKGISGIQSFATRHPQGFEIGTLGILGALGGLSMARRLGGISIGQLLRGARTTAITGKGVEGAITGLPPKGTATDPLFVVPLGGGLGGGGGGGIIAGERGALRGRMLPVLGKAGVVAFALYTGHEMAQTIPKGRYTDPVRDVLDPVGTIGRAIHDFGNFSNRQQYQFPTQRLRLRQLFGALEENRIGATPEEQTALDRFHHHRLSKAQLERRLAPILTSDQLRGYGITMNPKKIIGEVAVTVGTEKGLTVDGKKRKVVHVPLTLDSNPSWQAPQTRGKNKTHR